MRIDAHQHYWKYVPHEYAWIGEREERLKNDFMPWEYEPFLRKMGMDGSIAVQARQTEQETRFLADLAKKRESILAVVGWVDLRASGVGERLDYWRRFPKVTAFRHMVQDEPDVSAFLKDGRFNRGVRELQAREFAYEVLVKSPDIPAAVGFCSRHDDAVLILDHLGKPAIGRESVSAWKKRVAPLAAMPHVYCKISGLVTEAGGHAEQAEEILPFMLAALELFSPERVMFGSDWPVCLLAAELDAVYGLAQKATEHLTPSEQRSVWGLNACRVYGINCRKGSEGDGNGFAT